MAAPWPSIPAAYRLSMKALHYHSNSLAAANARRSQPILPFLAAPICHFTLPQPSFFRTLKLMEVHFGLETEKKLHDLAAQSGRKTADELVQDVIEGYFDELAQTHAVLNSRYDDLKSGTVKPLPADEIEAYFRDKSKTILRSKQ